MLLRLAATFFALIGLPAAAQCVGESYLDQLSAQDRAELAAAAAEMPYAEGLLWTATKDDRRVTVVGTMHIYDPRLEDIRARIQDTVQSADLIMLEATPEDKKALEQLLITDPGILFINEGPTLRDLVDDETWGLIADAANARSIPPFMAAKMQPWYLSIMLSVPPCAMQGMMAGDLGLDLMIMEDAEDAGVPMQSLEDVTTLFDIFNSDPIEDQIDMLRINLLSPDAQKQMFVAMLDRYFAGDVGTLWEMSRFAIMTTPGVDPAEAEDLFAQTEAALLIDRNRNWMPVIRDATQMHDDIVVAVGAAHLIGDDGILQFLDDEGWTLQQMQ